MHASHRHDGGDTHTSNSYGKFRKSTGTTGTLEHAPVSPCISKASGVPVSVPVSEETGTSLFVSTGLESWATDRPHVFARDVQINDTAFRRLDPEYYAWLRSKMQIAKMARDADRIGRDEFEELRLKFNAVHEWAVTFFSEARLIEATRNLDARDYTPPLAETETPRRAPRTTDGLSADAVAMVDAIRDRALALGWTGESLYGAGSSRFALGRERGLGCYLKPGDRIGEVTTHSIEIILPNHVRQRFYNPNVDQPWIRRNKTASE